MKRLVVVLAVLLVLAVLVAVAGIVIAGRGGDGPALGGDRLLVWEIDRPIVDWAPPPTLPLAAYDTTDTLERLYRAFHAARRADDVPAVAVFIRSTSFGLAKAQELRRQLAALSAAGKTVACYLETAGDGRNGTLPYYLATACDEIWISPAGELAPVGLYLDAAFFAGTLEKLKVEPEYSHVGRYKGAGETFTRRQLSESTRLALEELLDSDFRQIVTAIAEARGLEEAAVRDMVDGAPYSPRRALRLGLVDRIAYPDELLDDLEERFGEVPHVDLRDLVSRRHTWAERSRVGAPTVAVVFAVGTIVRGGGGSSPWSEEVFMGSDDMGDLLAELRDDGSVDAVVLRIDSPGGSALASDLILRQVELLAAEKPVVVSMSDVAASGGYYIAAKADRIVAEAATLTGSIGVVGGKLVTRRFQEEMLGITHDTLQRGANADLYSGLETYTPEQEAAVERSMRRIYSLFVSHVATGRDMEREAVEAVAQGRVWSGEDAHRHGLVDELGGLDRALELAREEAGIDPEADLRLLFFPRQPSLFELFTGGADETAGVRDLPPALRQALAALERPAPGLLELPPELRSVARPF